MLNEKDVLQLIYERLGDLPEKIAEHLSEGRETRFGLVPRRQRHSNTGGGADDSASKDPHDRWQATQGLLSAGGAFFSPLGQIAGAMRDIQRFDDAFTRFAEAWKKPPALPAPEFVGPPAPVATAIPYPSYPLKPEDWTPPKETEPARPAALYQPPLGTKPEDWQPKQELAENEFEVDAETMAAFRAKLNPGFGLKPENWTPPEIVKESAPLSGSSDAVKPPVPMPAPFGLKPEDYRPQPFEIAPDWTPPEETRPQLPLANTAPYGLAKEWTPPVDMDRPEPLGPMGKGTPEGWEGVKPMMGLSGLAEMLAGGKGEKEEGESKLAEKLDKVIEKLDELKGAVEEGNEQETSGAPSPDEREQGSRKSMWEQESPTSALSSEKRAEQAAHVSLPGRPARVPAREESGGTSLTKKALEMAKKALTKK